MELSCQQRSSCPLPQETCDLTAPYDFQTTASSCSIFPADATNNNTILTTGCIGLRSIDIQMQQGTETDWLIAQQTRQVFFDQGNDPAHL